MSIYIPGMELPKSCISCPFMISRDNDDCILQNEKANESFENWEQMKAGCPLVEVPPHGALKDADALWGKVKSERALKEHCPKSRSIIYDTGFLAGYRAACQIASKMPIIIPADPEESP